MKSFRQIGFVSGILIGMLFFFFPQPDFISVPVWKVLGCALWMVCWWISEAVPLYVTALLPMVLFPLTGIADVKSVTANYADPIIFLFMGGFLIALGIEESKLHVRIALNIVKIVGTSANGIIAGFMIATALISMWISNTATTVMMLPIAMSVVKILIDNDGILDKNEQNFALCLLLGIAYAANIGGTATLIGTPPNVVMAAIIKNMYGLEITFGNWMLIGIPFSIILLIATYLIMVKWLYPNRMSNNTNTSQLILNRLKELGPMRRNEKIVTAIFIFTALCWISRTWLNVYISSSYLNDTTIAMLGGILMFVVPVNFFRSTFIINWEATRKLPWGILILFGGGLALAGAMQNSGIIEMIGENISAYSFFNKYTVLAMLILIMLFMTELMSNVALATIFIPVVGGIAVGMELSPLFMCIPVTLASSCAFMLPVSTPPNAIVFGTGHIRMASMLRIGIYLNMISALSTLLISYLIIEKLLE